MKPRLVLCPLLLCLLATAGIATENGTPPPSTADSVHPPVRVDPPFPSLYFSDTVNEEALAARAHPYWAESSSESAATEKRLDDYSTLLLNDDLVAFYGSPRSKRMGILGRYPIERMDALLDEYAARYDALNGDRGVVKAYYLIYGTVWPGGEIGYLPDETVTRYIEFAAARGALVFLDHQIGKYGVQDSLKRMLPYLRYPNVHLALDPEWRTLKPMEEIGTVSAAEVNDAQRIIQDYLVEHGLKGTRMLVIHQFNWRMISNRPAVDATYPRVKLIHCADGFGSPALKKLSYAYNAQAANIPLKGFKLFLETPVEGVGVDEPLLSPEEVLALDPRPYLIMYQ